MLGNSRYVRHGDTRPNQISDPELEDIRAGLPGIVARTRGGKAAPFYQYGAGEKTPQADAMRSAKVKMLKTAAASVKRRPFINRSITMADILPKERMH